MSVGAILRGGNHKKWGVPRGKSALRFCFRAAWPEIRPIFSFGPVRRPALEGRSMGRPGCSECRFRGLGVFLGHSEGWIPPKVGGPTWEKCPRDSILSRLAPATVDFWFLGPQPRRPPNGPKMAQNGAIWGEGRSPGWHNGTGHARIACTDLGNGFGDQGSGIRDGFGPKMCHFGPFWAVLAPFGVPFRTPTFHLKPSPGAPIGSFRPQK